MKGTLLLLAGATILTVSSCKKERKEDPVLDFNGKQSAMLTTFADNIATQSYNDINNAATDLQASIEALYSVRDNNSLTEAQIRWKTLRDIWEQTEAYYTFGPGKDSRYNDQIDTWPTSAYSLDSLLEKTGYDLSVSELQKLPSSFRGLHAMEWVLFGKDGMKNASNITGRQGDYMRSLAADLKSNCQALYFAWSTAPTNYAVTVKNAGNGSEAYKTKQAAILTMVDALSSLCGNISDYKLELPFILADSNSVESPYADYSVTDIKNNLLGLRNVYQGKYRAYTGVGLTDLVKEKNQSLDNKILQRIDSSIIAANAFTVSLDKSIFVQRSNIGALMVAVDSLQSTVKNDLRNFVLDNIK